MCYKCVRFNFKRGLLAWLPIRILPGDSKNLPGLSLRSCSLKMSLIHTRYLAK